MNAFNHFIHRLSHNQRGALWMLGSAISFVSMTTLVKYLGNDYPAVLQIFYRQVAGFIVVLPLILRSSEPVFRSPRPMLVVTRSMASLTGTSLSFYSYQHLPLADANALSFTRTLWIVLLAAWLLREPLGIKRMGSTLVGFAGVLLIVNPHAEALHGASLAALLSALLLAWSVTGLKSMTRDHSVLTMVALAGVLGLAFSFPAALLVWRWPTGWDLLLLALMGWCGIITQTCYIKGMALGDASVMAPMDYTRLLFAISSGWLFFNTLPSLRTLIGAVIIIASTLYVTSVRDEPKASAQL